MFNYMLLSSTYFQLKYLRLSYNRVFINSNIFTTFAEAAVGSGPVEKALLSESLFKKFLGYYPVNLFKKDTPAQLLFFEFCKKVLGHLFV